MDIKTTKQPDGYWVAIDADDYDVDCDENGYFSNSPAGFGHTETEAIRELLAEIEERADAKARNRSSAAHDAGHSAGQRAQRG